ncbi:MAG: UDP-glucose 4-epimerase GalE, partial [Chlamydiia bacterium]|nr:UDP-glucose 4-epimerase GalE [Chlamydiia bacterium]
MRKILIVGGAGYIGSHLFHYLQRKGVESVAIDNLSRGLSHAIPQTHLVVGDLANKETLSAVFDTHPISAVMHLASLVDLDASLCHPDRYYRENCVHSLNLLEVMQQHGVNKLIFSSSAAVYGSPTHSPIPETDPMMPLSPYGESKAAVEMMLKRFHTAYGIDSCSLRFFNAAGADPEGQHHHYYPDDFHLIPRLLRDKRATIYGTDHSTPDGTCIRDYIHVWDLAEAHHLAMNWLKTNPGAHAFNLGSGQGFSVSQVIRAIEEVTGETLPQTVGQKRPADPPQLVADTTKAHTLLKWHPQ